MNKCELEAQRRKKLNRRRRLLLEDEAGITVGDTTGAYYFVSGVGTSLAVDTPAGTTDGDLLLMFIGQSEENDLYTPTVPAGWVEVEAIYAGTALGTDHCCRTWYKVADGEGATIAVQCSTINTYKYSLFVTRFSGVHADVFDVTPDPIHAATHDNDHVPTPQPITTNTNNAVVVTHFDNMSSAMTVIPQENPDGYTTLGDYADTSYFTAQCYRVVETAGVETIGQWPDLGSSTSTDTGTVTLALKPA